MLTGLRWESSRRLRGKLPSDVRVPGLLVEPVSHLGGRFEGRLESSEVNSSAFHTSGRAVSRKRSSRSACLGREHRERVLELADPLEVVLGDTP